MRYLFKSALRSVARSPLQTIILLVTVVLSALLFTIITETSCSVKEESERTSEAKYGNADIIISADADGSSAYIGSADIAAAVDDGDLFCGYMILPACDGENTSLGAATDFETVSGIFDFSFTEYGRVTTENINSSIFISDDFAAERGLTVGDSCVISVLGTTAEYVVQGVNSHYFFGTYSFIVNVEGVLDMLSDISPVFTVFDGENVPYNTVYVRTGGDAEQKISAINSALAGTGWSAETAQGNYENYKDLIITILLPAAVLFTAVIAGVLVYFSLDIISRRRAGETANFILAGTSAAKAALAFIIETTAYIALGTLLGIALAGWILPAIAAGNYEYATLFLTFRGAAVCIAAELAVEVTAAVIYFARHKRVKKSKNARAFAVIAVCAAVIFICVILSFFIGVGYLYVLSLIEFIALVALIFACVAPLCRGTEKTFSPLAEKSRGGGARLSLALKNSANTAEIHNVLRILCVLLSVSIAAAACFSYMSGMVEVYTQVLDCDYLVMNADESVAEQISLVDGTKDCCVCGIYSGKFSNGVKFYLADVGDSDFTYGNDYSVEGNGIYLPETYADLLGISVGDAFTLTVSKTECAFTLEGFVNGGGVMGYFNADYFGFNKNIVLVRADSSYDYIARLSQSAAVYGAFVQTFESVFASQIRTVKNITRILRIYMILMCAAAAIGAVNLVAVCYAERKNQFAALKLVGMTRGDVAAMIACEALLIAAFTIIISAACGAFSCCLLNNALRSFAFSMFG